MQRSQVFKVKGMQRDLSMANTQGEFAYEIVNMRLLPAEEDAGLSLTNEQGTLCVITDIDGEVLGQCPTSDSLVVFTHEEVVLENNDIQNIDRIYKISYNGTTWLNQCLYEGNLNFQTKIEAIFNYETSDIQKVYWIDGINQLRCINLEDYPKATWNDSSFDSVKQIDSLPTVEIERTTGGSFVAGVLQYYISYFTEFGSESPIVYTSPLLYLAHENRGGNVNDPVSTAFKLTLSNLDATNWDSIRIYVTHRTSLDATPEGSIIQELKIPEDGIIEVTDYGLNRVSIAPNDLYFIGGKFVKAGTMTVKDQVMFLGNLDIESAPSLNYEGIKNKFQELKEQGILSTIFSTATKKIVPNSLEEYQNKYYVHEFKLNNTKSITHYKYGEKYRFGISLMDKYGVWSSPIWLLDAVIETPPEQINIDELALPCPTLYLETIISYEQDGQVISGSLWNFLMQNGAVDIRPLVVFPDENERKIITQGVVCPTVYNLKDRKENGPYAQASWFMRPNVPADLWGIRSSTLGTGNTATILNGVFHQKISHKSDVIQFAETYANINAGYYGAGATNVLHTDTTGMAYLYDDFSVEIGGEDGAASADWNSKVQQFSLSPEGLATRLETTNVLPKQQEKYYKTGNWVEFRHNYALRSKGWSFGSTTATNHWGNNSFFTSYDYVDKADKKYTIYKTTGMTRGAELDTSRFDCTAPVNRFNHTSDKGSFEGDKYTVDRQKIYFCTTISPKEFHKQQRDGKCPSVFVVYKHIDSQSNLEYVEIIDVITFPKEKTFKYNAKNSDARYTKYYCNFTAPNEYITIPLKLLGAKPAKYPWDYDYRCWLQLKLNRSETSRSLTEGGIKYYIWEIRDKSNIKIYDGNIAYTPETLLYDYVYSLMPEFTIYLKSSDESLRFGETSIELLNAGTSAYYIDNSIVTLNSPEAEYQKGFNPNLSNVDFRIIGLIPLTATSSDISLKVKDPKPDLGRLGSGLIRRQYSNTNIGYQGFKGIVASNAYLAQVENETYSLVPLYPWQSTGTLGRYTNSSDSLSDFVSKDLLEQKILSNLRYSASTYYFPPNALLFMENYDDRNRSYLDNNIIIGWQPATETHAQLFTGETEQDIIKLTNLSYPNSSLVYKGVVKSLASLTYGESNESISNPIYSFGQNVQEDGTISSSAMRMNMPAMGSFSDNVEGNSYYKTSQAAAIRYKSSPHFVVGFGCFDSLWESSQKVQEILPAWRSLNEEGLWSLQNIKQITKNDQGEEEIIKQYVDLDHRRAYESRDLSSLYHQEYIGLPYEAVNQEFKDGSIYNPFRCATINKEDFAVPNYGWLWLGELCRKESPTFGGTSEFALSNNQWTLAGKPTIYMPKISEISISADLDLDPIVLTLNTNMFLPQQTNVTSQLEEVYLCENKETSTVSIYFTIRVNKNDEIDPDFNSLFNIWCTSTFSYEQYENLINAGKTVNTSISCDIPIYQPDGSLQNVTYRGGLTVSSERRETETIVNLKCTIPGVFMCEIHSIPIASDQAVHKLEWTIGDTYYQRFDTLKTYAYSESDQNSVIDITSFMVETRINIDGRYDRNRGQESNLQMSPTNFNLFNDVYNQKDNFFTYRILDDDVQNRTNFKNQITWSLSKTAGETIDSWLNVTLASVLDLDGTKGDLTALKTFGNNIVAFQDSGISQILFNSRVQIPTSESVPIQIANSGKVDGQQFITTDIGCQDKWNIVTTSQGLYFIDYRDKSIYKFNGQLANLSAAGGFRGWCEKHITDQSTIVGYYDIKNKEVMFYDSNFRTESIADPVWLGFSEMSNHFSSFYTYPEAYLTRVQGIPVWLHNNSVFQHQAGDYNDLLGGDGTYGLTVNTRQDSNLVKTFNNVEFRADTYLKDSEMPEEIKTFDTIQIEDEYNGPTSATLEFKPYRPSNLKKYLRTWRAQIPRVDNKYNRYVNQWAKIGLWMKAPNTEKTILHDMAVWYSE